MNIGNESRVIGLLQLN